MDVKSPLLLLAWGTNPTEFRLQIVQRIRKDVFLLRERVDVRGNDRRRVAACLRSDNDSRVAMQESPPIRPEMPCIVQKPEVIRVVRNEYPITLGRIEKLMGIGRAFTAFVVCGNHRVAVVA